MLEPNCRFVASPLANNCVNLSNLLNSMLQFLYLSNGNNISTYLIGLLVGIKWVSICKVLLRVPGQYAPIISCCFFKLSFFIVSS